MKLILPEPTRVEIFGNPLPLKLGIIKQDLTYRNKAIQFDIKRLENQLRFQAGIRGDFIREEIEALKKKAKICLLNQDEDGTYWALSGLAQRIQSHLDCEVESKLVYQEPKALPWSTVPVYKMYPYQQTSFEKLLQARHAGVELATGLGKTFIILHLARALGLKTVIMTPASNISEQIYELFVQHLGKKYVGRYWGGKKEAKKLIVIGNGQSFTRITPGSPDWKLLKETQVFMADESHMTPAETLSRVCTGVLADAPYRFFFSATQLRNDGLDILLEGITGPMVHRMTAKEGMDQGYLAKTFFKVIQAHSASTFSSQDVNEMTRKHAYYNPDVNQKAATIINAAVGFQKHQVLVLIDEIEQFSKLLPLLKFQCKFAHGGTAHDELPPDYKDSDPAQLVKDFNDGKFPILIGTSCISTGTDIKACKTMVRLKFGKSRIEVMQDTGRCTRLMPSIGKTECNVFDFDVVNIEILSKHTEIRKQIYEEINGPVKLLNL